MRIFAYIVAALSLAAALGCMIAIPKFHSVYQDMEVALPILTRFVLTYGVLLSALFLLLSVSMIVLAAINKPGIAVATAGLTLLLLLVTGILVPVALMLPMSTVAQALEDSGTEESPAPDSR